MSMFQITFSTGNAAFAEGFAYEVENIMDQVADQLEAGQEFGRLRDSNGNRVGFWVHGEEAADGGVKIGGRL